MVTEQRDYAVGGKRFAPRGWPGYARLVHLDTPHESLFVSADASRQANLVLSYRVKVPIGKGLITHLNRVLQLCRRRETGEENWRGVIKQIHAIIISSDLILCEILMEEL